MYYLFCVVLCIVCVCMCTVLLPPGGYPIAVKYIISCTPCAMFIQSCKHQLVLRSRYCYLLIAAHDMQWKLSQFPTKFSVLRKDKHCWAQGKDLSVILVNSLIGCSTLCRDLKECHPMVKQGLMEDHITTRWNLMFCNTHLFTMCNICAVWVTCSLFSKSTVMCCIITFQSTTVVQD
jgi:hypothetical protein